MRQNRKVFSELNPTYVKPYPNPPCRKTQPSPLIHLQRTLGNQGFQHFIRPKLKIGQPNDKYEQEADRIAARVMRMPEPRVLQQQEEEDEELIQQKPLSEQISPLVQRQNEEEKEEAAIQTELISPVQPALQRQEESEEEIKGEPLQTKRKTQQTPQIPPTLETSVQALKERGQPLSLSARTFFEPRFNYDFSHVRVHTDSKAAQAANSINAKAFTIGRNVLFGAGNYDHAKEDGRRLLAHEFTHVIQQTGPFNTGKNKFNTKAWNTIQRQFFTPLGPGGGYGGLMERDRRRTQKEDEGATQRIQVPTSPGWVEVEPTYLLLPYGEPFELPHFLRVQEESESENEKKNVTILEGRYKGKDANIKSNVLGPDTEANSPVSAKFVFDPETGQGEFWYGRKGPVDAKTQPENPTPEGTHDIEIPDFHHELGSKYGDFATTWFRIGHSGDRYLHPGRVSLGCTTVEGISEWPSIWRYLTTARKDDQSLGELEVKSEATKKQTE